MTGALPQPDFLRPVARPGWLAWAWCGTGLLVLAVSAADSHAAWQARQQAQDRLARAQTGMPRASLSPVQASTAQAASQRAAAQARQAEALRWRQQLALPWPVVWAASEATVGGVQWLLLDQGSSGGLRLAGLAADLAAAEAAADAVRQQQRGDSPAWQGVALAAVERLPGGLRFELVASLAGQGADGTPNSASAGTSSGMSSGTSSGTSSSTSSRTSADTPTSPPTNTSAGKSARSPAIAAATSRTSGAAP